MNPEFEKYAREQFLPEEIEVDTDALWNEVYPHVKKDKRKRRFLWFFLSGLFVGLSVFGAYLYFQNTASDPISSITDQSESKQTAFDEKSTTTFSLSDPVDTGVAGEPSLVNPTEDSAETTIGNTTVTKIDETTDYIEIAEPLIRINNEVDKPMLTSPPTNSTQTKGTSTANNYQAVDKNKPALPLATTTPRPGNIIEKKTSPSSDASNPSNDKVEVVKEAEKKRSRLLNLQVLAAANFPFDLWPDPEVLPTVLTEEEARVRAEVEDEENTPPPPKKILGGIRFGIGLYGGIGKSSISLDTEDSSQGYTNTRNQTERQLETLHAGIDLSLVSKQGLYLRTGGEYTRIASVFSESSQLVTVDSIDGITEIIINKVLNDTTFVTGKIGVTNTVDYEKRTYNYIHLIDIPVIVGYQFSDESWSIGLEGGIYANISAKYTGEILNQDDTFYDLESDPDSWYKTNIGITPFIGLNASYAISDNLQIHVSPGFKFNTLFSTDTNILTQRQSTLGIRLGVRYLFD